MINLSVSNIAWTPEQDEEAYTLLKELGVHHIELAPSRWFPDLRKVPIGKFQRHLDLLKSYELEVVAFQSLLYGHPELSIFGDKWARTADYLDAVILLASQAKAEALVFGSPKNRKQGQVKPSTKSWRQALRFFRQVGETAAKYKTCVCIEPNPTAYNCDFINTVYEAVELVDAVNSEGFRYHLDTAGMHLQEDDGLNTLKKFAQDPQLWEFENSDPMTDPPQHEGRLLDLVLSRLGHFHVSEPYLGDFAEPQVDHKKIAWQLRDLDYRGVISIEMKPSSRGLEAVREAITYVKEVYLAVGA